MNINIVGRLQMLAFSVALPLGLMAQTVAVTESGAQAKSTVRDNFYDRTLHTQKLPIAYDYVNERDVMWEKRIWREIPLQAKRNHVFSFAKRPFITVLLDAAKRGDITLYSTLDDAFTVPLCMDEVFKLGVKSDTVVVVDPETFEETTQVIHNDFDPNTVVRYRLKEVWFFDSKNSTMNVRILGIAPIAQRFDNDGNLLHESPLFWVYYPEARTMLAQEEAFNSNNDGVRLSWDDMMEARLFESFITKESNVFDRRIQDYKSGEDALVEGERIKESILNYELNLWED